MLPRTRETKVNFVWTKSKNALRNVNNRSKPGILSRWTERLHDSAFLNEECLKPLNLFLLNRVVSALIFVLEFRCEQATTSRLDDVVDTTRQRVHYCFNYSTLLQFQLLRHSNNESSLSSSSSPATIWLESHWRMTFVLLHRLHLH